MKKIMLQVIIVALLSTFVIAAPKIKEGESIIQKNELKEMIGLLDIDFKISDRSYFNFVMDKTREGIIEDPTKPLALKNKETAYLETFRNDREKCLMFRIRHTKPVHRKKGGVTVVFTDAKGRPVKHSLLDTTIKWSGNGTMYEQVFLIKPDKELIKENYPDDVIPLQITITFMDKNRKTYIITPR
ncbi:MAG TPA: hypothetical protein PLM53_19805 [Spirochaetota bacterium]|nr:hypothetical protein [Spirochaetota bacterium]HPC43270.1 hypothetical protein [Spirochaetota bacterium]HPL17975.1 hypothetical protein [Spirochaetota bacterium]HQF10441.1 hypothetical protein [Spirochaetota bacterium]HQH99340.1 hypothetical protein [Spirochaetota bacterium]